MTGTSVDKVYYYTFHYIDMTANIVWPEDQCLGVDKGLYSLNKTLGKKPQNMPAFITGILKIHSKYTEVILLSKRNAFILSMD